MGLALALLTAFLWSATSIILRRSMIDIGVLNITFIISIVGIPVAFFFALISGGLNHLLEIEYIPLAYASVAGIINFVGGRFLWYRGIDLIGASRTNSIVATEAMFAPFLAVVLLGEIPPLILTPAALLIFLGAFSISKSGESSNEKLNFNKRKFTLGIVISVMAAIVFTIGALLTKVSVSLIGNPFQAMLIGVLVSSIFLSGTVCIKKESWAGFKEKSRKALLLAALTQSFASISFWNAFSLAPVVLIVPTLQSYPLITLILSYLFIRRLEKLNRAAVIGSFFIVIALVLIVLYW